MLDLAKKREVLCSFPELREISASNGRYNYELQNLILRRRIIAREFSPTGNGYILGTPQTVHKMDDRGWINVRNLDESELRKTVRDAIDALRSADLHQRYSQLLKDSGFLPLTSETWRRLELLHEPPANENQHAAIRNAIESEVGNANGLYIYTCENGGILYVGNAKPLKGRIWSHYLESFQTVRGDTKDNRWHRFFSSHQGKVTVYWMELEDEPIRQIVEQTLALGLKPAFLNFE